MSKQYLHLAAYSCEVCQGPVVSASTAVRENVISRETDIRQVGAMCLACGHRQDSAIGPVAARHLSPIEWEPVKAPPEPGNLTTAYVNALNRAELH